MQRLERIENRVTEHQQNALSGSEDDAGICRVACEEHHKIDNMRLDEENHIQDVSAFTHKHRDLIGAGSICQMLVEARNWTLQTVKSSPTNPDGSSTSQHLSATLNNALLNTQSYKLSLEDVEQYESVLDIPVSLAKRWVKS